MNISSSKILWNSLLEAEPLPLKRLWVALSGGVDSKTLLHWLIHREKSHLPLSTQVSAVHLRHYLETDEPLWEEDCQRFCQAWKIPLVIMSAPSPRHSSMGLEASARHARLVAWQTLAQQEIQQQPEDYPANRLWLAQGHHANDRAETLLHRIGRGTGINGLAVLPFISHFSMPATQLSVVRPLLDWTKSAINDYAREHNIVGADDPANQDPLRTRSHIRHRILPAMLTTFPSFLHQAGEIANIAHMEREILQVSAQRELDALRIPTTLISPSANISFEHSSAINRQGFLKLSIAYQMLIFRHWWQSCHDLRSTNDMYDGTHHHLSLRRLRHVLAMLRARSQGQIAPLPTRPTLMLMWQKDQMLLANIDTSAQNHLIHPPILPITPLSINVLKSGECDWAGGRLMWDWQNSLEAKKGGIHESLLPTSTLIIRSRQSGDKYQPQSNRPRRPLRKWMSEEGLALEVRDLLPVLTWNDQILGVIGLGLSAFAFDACNGESPTVKTLVITWRHPRLGFYGLSELTHSEAKARIRSSSAITADTSSIVSGRA